MRRQGYTGRGGVSSYRLWVRQSITVNSENLDGKSCAAIKQQNPTAEDGQYTVLVSGRAQRVYCDMSTDGGGWTLVAVARYSHRGQSGWNAESALNVGSSTSLSAHWHFSSADITAMATTGEYRANCFESNNNYVRYWYGVTRYYWGAQASMAGRGQCNTYQNYDKSGTCYISNWAAHHYGLISGNNERDTLLTSHSGNHWACAGNAGPGGEGYTGRNGHSNLRLWVRSDPADDGGITSVLPPATSGGGNPSRFGKPTSLISEWDFMGSAKDRVGSLDLTLNGAAKLAPGGGLMVHGDGYARSTALSTSLTAMTLEVWVQVTDLAQRGGGAMSIDDTASGGEFDGIGYASQAASQWAMTSTGGKRSLDDAYTTGAAEHESRMPVQMVMVVNGDGSRELYRDGALYASHSAPSFTHDAGKATVLLGCAAHPCATSSLLSGKIYAARLYNDALTAHEVALLHDRFAPGFAELSAAPDGLYPVVGSDGQSRLASCDQTTMGGGWTRFWWLNKGASVPWGDADALDVLGSPFGLCDAQSTTEFCFGRMPTGLPEHRAELLARDTEGSVYVWSFDPDNEVAHAAWRAFVDHEVVLPDDAQGSPSDGSWNPTVVQGKFHGKTQSRFQYRTESGVASFLLGDADLCSCLSTLAAGASLCRDGADSGGGRGTEALNGATCAGTGTDAGLELFFRVRPAENPPIVSLQQTAVEVQPDGNTLRLAVVRSGDASSAVSVQFSTEEGTALEGVDYTAVSGSLRWSAGETASKAVSVPIRKRNVLAAAKQFRVQLRSPQGVDIRDGGGATVVTIKSDSDVRPGPLTLKAEGGALDRAADVALSATVFASSTIPGYVYHQAELVNDGRYGNTNSWIHGSTTVNGKQFIGLVFREPVAVASVAWGRDNLGSYDDRWRGTYTVQVTAENDIDANTPDSAWTTVDTVTGAGPRRHEYSFNAAIESTALRVVVNSELTAICIDELEVYAGTPPPQLDKGLMMRLDFRAAHISTDGDDVTWIADSSGSGHPAKMVGSVQFPPDSSLPVARFAQGAGYLEVPSLNNHEFEAFTASFVFRRTTVAGYQGLLSYGYGEDLGWEVRMGREWGGQMIGGGVKTTDKDSVWDFIDRADPLGELHHIVISYDGVRELRFFIDGRKFRKQVTGAPKRTEQSFLLGTASPTTHEDFGGDMMDVRLYNRSLTDVEVLKLWAEYEDVILMEDMSAWWRLSENAGDIVSDATVFARTGRLLGGTKWGSGGLYFDGVDDWVRSDDNLGIAGNAGFTMCAWILWDDDSWSSDYPSFMGMNNEGSANMHLSFTVKDGRPAVDFWNYRVRARETLEVKTWHFVCGTKTPGSKLANTHVYVNGVDVVVDLEGDDGAPAIVDAPLVLGRLDSTRWFKGGIDDARFFDRAVSQRRITAMYEGALVAWWPGRDGDGPLVDITQPAKHEGALFGGADWNRNLVEFSGGAQSVVSSAGSVGVTGDVALSLCLWVFSSSESWASRAEIAGFRPKTTGAAGFNTGFTLGAAAGRVGVDFEGVRLQTTRASVGTRRWHHICVVKSPGPKTSNTVLYVDSTQQTDVELVDDGIGGQLKDSAPAVNDGPLRLARVSGRSGAANAFSGYIRDIRLYRRTLVTEEVESVWLAGTAVGNNGNDDDLTQDYGLGLNGNGDYATVPPFTFGAESFTIEAWAYCRKPWDDTPTIFEIADGADDKVVSLRLDKNTAVTTLSVVNRKSQAGDVSSSSAFPALRWIHVAAVFDKPTGVASIFWDGSLVGQGALPEAVSAVRRLAFVGKRTIPTPRTWNGYIDELRVWNTVARTSEQIISTMNVFPEVTSGDDARRSGLALYLRFDPVTETPWKDDALGETTVVDASLQERDATVTCAAACVVPSVRGVAVCGNGFRESRGDEQCDDGNTIRGDGCSETCQVEDGWACISSHPLSADTCQRGQIGVSDGFDDAGDDTTEVWVKLLEDAGYGGTWERTYTPLRTGITVTGIKAVWRSGYVTCNRAYSGNGFRWQTCNPSHGDVYSFELKRNSAWVLSTGGWGTLPSGCAKPVPNQLTNGRIGDIVCDVEFDISEGDTLTPTWYEPARSTSLGDNGGEIRIDLYGKVRAGAGPWRPQAKESGQFIVGTSYRRSGKAGLKIANSEQNYFHFGEDTSRLETSNVPWPTRDFTNAFWVRSTDGGAGALVSYATPSSDNEALLYHNTGNLYPHVHGQHGNFVLPSSLILDGLWHHVAWQWRRVNGAQHNMFFYRDGVLEKSAVETAPPDRDTERGGYLILGQEQDCQGGCLESSQNFVGDIHSFNLWDKILSNAEVVAIMRSAPDGSEAGLVLAWNRPLLASDGVTVTGWEDDGPRTKNIGLAGSPAPAWRTSRTVRYISWGQREITGVGAGSYINVQYNIRSNGEGRAVPLVVAIYVDTVDPYSCWDDDGCSKQGINICVNPGSGSGFCDSSLSVRTGTWGTLSIDVEQQFKGKYGAAYTLSDRMRVHLGTVGDLGQAEAWLDNFVQLRLSDRPSCERALIESKGAGTEGTRPPGHIMRFSSTGSQQASARLQSFSSFPEDAISSTMWVRTTDASGTGFMSYQSPDSGNAWLL